MAQSEKARLIQLVKIGQKQLEMSDDSYRAMLVRLTHKNSATKCSLADLHKVMHELQQKGAKIKWYPKKSLKPTEYSPATGSQAVKSEITHKIRAVWIEMGKQGFLADRCEKGLNRFIRNMLNRGRKKKGETLLLVYVHTLSQRQATAVLEALKSWHKREMLKALAAMGIVLPKQTAYEAVNMQFTRLRWRIK